MSKSDPVSDMLTRIRNGQLAGKISVEIPSSKLKVAILNVLQSEGYVGGYNVKTEESKASLTVYLKYHDNQKVIEIIQRKSRPGLRVYKSHNTIPQVMNGLGISIFSTSKGVMTGRNAKSLGIGGEFLCIVA
jgi:small subunit ribosomal protein S8